MPRSSSSLRALQLFGQRVRSRRVELGLTQEALAEVAGLDRSYVWRLERGARNASLRNIVRVADALDVDPGDLLRGL